MPFAVLTEAKVICQLLKAESFGETVAHSPTMHESVIVKTCFFI